MKEQQLWDSLKALKPFIKKQTYKTIKGQIKAGDIEGARKGIERINNGLLLQ